WKDVRHLEGARHPGADARARGQPRHVGAVEQHFARVGEQLPGEQVDEGGLARAVGADHCGDAAGGKRQVDAGDRDEVGKRLAHAARFEERAHAASFRGAVRGRGARRHGLRASRDSAAPRRPPRNASTTPRSTSPKTSSQYSVYRTISSLMPRYTTAPTMGPANENGPPMSAAITGSADLVQCAAVGATVCSSGASRAPASPANAPATTKARKMVRRTRMPLNSARSAFSRIARRASPSGERERRCSTPVETRTITAENQ